MHLTSALAVSAATCTAAGSELVHCQRGLLCRSNLPVQCSWWLAAPSGGEARRTKTEGKRVRSVEASHAHHEAEGEGVLPAALRRPEAATLRCIPILMPLRFDLWMNVDAWGDAQVHAGTRSARSAPVKVCMGCANGRMDEREGGRCVGVRILYVSLKHPRPPVYDESWLSVGEAATL